MAKNDNSVNIPSSGERYHHGDLRAALVEEGLKQLKGGPASGLSLREIARNVGVSATAVYRHFPDRAALLAALGAEGDQQLADAFAKAMAKKKPGREAFNAMGQAYVRFALANPWLFRLMMSSEAHKEQREESPARGMLVKGIEELGGPKLTKTQQDVRRLRAWAVVHGLAVLMLEGLAPRDPKIIELVVDSEIL
jgi:AcrR family transcriptional regulator